MHHEAPLPFVWSNPDKSTATVSTPLFAGSLCDLTKIQYQSIERWSLPAGPILVHIL